MEKRISTVILGAMTDLANLVYPPLCMCCSAYTHPEVPLCYICAHTLDQPIPGEVRSHITGIHNCSPQTDVFALWIFEKDGPVQRIHRELKYGNRPYYGFVLGQLIGRAISQTGTGAHDTVVPVPLHRSRFMGRGYNQCDPLSEGIANVLGAPSDNKILTRTRRTQSQTNLSINDRKKNVVGAFRSTGASIQGKKVVLVDDVITTGATVSEAARVLFENGASKVTVAALGFARI